MDLNGVYASVCFPSFLPGFAGQRLQQLTDDPELALACVRAWNDWVIEDWAGVRARAHDPAADPVPARSRGRRPTRSGATPTRGFKAMTFSEAPHMLGLPSLHSGHWDPLMAACEETGTVVCLHVGSSGTSPATSPDAPSDTIGVLFFGYAMFAAVDWLYSRIPCASPTSSICLSEGGIGWVAGLLDRLEHVRKYDAMYGTWNDIALSPGRHVPPQLLGVRDRRPVGVPAARRDRRSRTSSWSPTTRTPTPRGRITQQRLAAQLAGLSDAEVARVTWANASELFRHPVPEAVQRDPNAY